jgi:DNA mismatch repair protein MutS2
VKALEEKVEAFQEKIEAPVERRPTADSEMLRSTLTGSSSQGQQSFALGEKVFLASLNTEGILTALGESDAEVQIGTLRVRARFSDLQRKANQVVVENRKAKRGDRESSNSQPAAFNLKNSPGMEISLRGKLVEDGLDELDKYLEKAYSAGLPFVRIVHGKGTGRMREAVRTALKDSPYVSSFEEAHDNEGGAGVTVAKLARD